MPVEDVILIEDEATEPEDRNAEIVAVAMRSTGLVRALMDYGMSISVRDAPQIALVGAVAVCGVITARHWYVEANWQRTAPAVLITLVAETAGGKETIVKLANSAAAILPCYEVAMHYASGVMVHERLAVVPTQLALIDEKGRKMEAQKFNGNQINAETALMEYYVRFPDSSIPAHRTRDHKNDVPAVPAPLLGGIQMSAPAPFFEALDRRDVVGRFARQAPQRAVFRTRQADPAEWAATERVAGGRDRGSEPGRRHRRGELV